MMWCGGTESLRNKSANSSYLKGRRNNGKFLSCMFIWVATIPRPPGGRDSHREPFEDQTYQLVQCETIARDGRNAQPRNVSGRTDVPLPPHKKADMAGATNNNQRVGPDRRHTDVDEEYCGRFQLLPEAEIRSHSGGRWVCQAHGGGGSPTFVGRMEGGPRYATYIGRTTTCSE